MAFLRHSCRHVVAFLACLVIFGPERFPIDEIIHQDIRVRLCSDFPGTRIIVESRTYERVRVPGGYEETPISSGPQGWREEKTIRLYHTIEKPKEIP